MAAALERFRTNEEFRAKTFRGAVTGAHPMKKDMPPLSGRHVSARPVQAQFFRRSR